MWLNIGKDCCFNGQLKALVVIKAIAALCLNEGLDGGRIGFCVLLDFRTLVSRARVDCSFEIDGMDDVTVLFAVACFIGQVGNDFAFCNVRLFCWFICWLGRVFRPKIIANCKMAFFVSSPACREGGNALGGFVSKVIMSSAACFRKVSVETIGKSIMCGKKTIVSAFISEVHKYKHLWDLDLFLNCLVPSFDIITVSK